MKYDKFDHKSLFLSHVDTNNPNNCWEWVASRFPDGYGRAKAFGKSFMAHRLSYTLFVGEIPDKLHVLHKCDNKSCVNPDHLFLGTRSDNMQDMLKKGRRTNVPKRNPAKLNHELAQTIRDWEKSGRFTNSELARMFGISARHIRAVLNYECWKPQR